MLTHVRERRPYTEVDRVARLDAQDPGPVDGPARAVGALGVRPRIGPITCTGPTSRPRIPGSGFEYKSLYDGWYTYPKEQRIVPQIQGPFYRNYYGGSRMVGIHKYAEAHHPWYKRKFYQGYHYILDVF